MAPARQRLAIRVLIVASLALGLVVTGSLVAAPSDTERKSEIERELAESQRDLSEARGREQVLTDEVAGFTSRIRSVEARLGPLESRLASLEAEVTSLHERREALTRRLATERRRLREAQNALARRRVLLARRLRDIYVRGEADPVVVLLQTGSLGDAAETARLIELVADQDRSLAISVREYAGSVRRTRDKIANVRAEVTASERRATAAAEEVRYATSELRGEKESLSKLQSGKNSLLMKVTAGRAELEAHTEALERESAALAARIRSAQASAPAPSGTAPPDNNSAPTSAPTSTSAPSSGGFIWPVSGPLTSTFGPRWGRMHEGLDISGSTGTGIAAAASGTVIIAGWSGGYGNLVVIDHGGRLSSAYAHMNSISVSTGQAVSQGSLVGGLGSTGNSTGPHLHFEIRSNGGAVNPLGYL